MIISKSILVYFSPTGTSGKNAKAFTAGMGVPFEEFDLTGLKERDNFSRTFAGNELLVTGLPVYGGRLPKNIEPFFSGLEGNNTPAVATVTYGNRAYDDALIELKLRLEERGFVLKAGAAFIGEHSLNKNIAAGRPDLNDLDIAGKFGKMVITSIASDTQGKISFGGSYPFTAKGSLPSYRPVTTKLCRQCGLCAAICPWGAIDDENYANVDPLKCFRCFRCIRNCPAGAKKITDEKFLAEAPGFTERLNAQRCKPELFVPH